MKNSNYFLVKETLINYLKIDGFLFSSTNTKVLSKNDNSFIITDLGVYHPAKGILNSLLDLNELIK